MSVEGEEESHSQLVEIVVQEFEVDPVTGMSAVVYTEDADAEMVIEEQETVPSNIKEEHAPENSYMNTHYTHRMMQVSKKEANLSQCATNNPGVEAEEHLDAGPWIVEFPTPETEAPRPRRKSRRSPSEVWSYFEKVDDQRARCERCSKLLAHCRNTTNLKNHLEICPGEKWKYSQDMIPISLSRPPRKKETAADKPQRRRRFPSDVWNHFEKVDKQRAKCAYCEKLIAHSGNTSNLRQHLEVIHQIKRPENSEILQTPVSVSKFNMLDLSTKKLSNEPETLRTKLFHFYLQRFFVENCLPFDMVETKSFQDLIKLLDKKMQVPSRTTLVSRVDELYGILKSAYISELEQLNNFSLTCETWNDALSSLSYLAVTVHFLNENSVDSITIGTRQVEASYTSMELGVVIQEVLDDWQIPNEKISACVTNGTAKNILDAVNSFVTSDRRLHCFACNLNIVVTDAIEKCSEIIVSLEKIKNIVTYFKRNEKAADVLRKEQETQNEVPLKLIQSCPSRWVSVCEMLERYLKLETVLAKTICEDITLDIELPTKDERDMLEECTKLLCPFFEATKEISSEKYVSASKVLPICKILNLAVISVTVTSEQAMSLKEHLLRNMKLRLLPLEDIKLLNLCTILDPRFKTRPISNQLAKSKALLAINKELQEIESSLKKVDNSKNGSSNDVANVSKHIWDFYNLLPYKSKNSKESYNDELTHYLDVPPIDRQANPLQFWNDHKQSYASLYLTARKYSSIVGNSVPSECLFSKAGLANTEKRNRLPLKNAEKLLFLCSLSENRWNAVAI